jgi:hypothetical protein
MPLGFFGSAVVALGVPVLLALFYAFVWPNVVAGRAQFLAMAVVAGLVVGAIAWWCAFSIVANIGISGEASAGGKSAEAFAHELNMRFAIAVVAASVAEFALCAAIAHFLGRK